MFPLPICRVACNILIYQQKPRNNIQGVFNFHSVFPISGIAIGPKWIFLLVIQIDTIITNLQHFQLETQLLLAASVEQLEQPLKIYNFVEKVTGISYLSWGPPNKGNK